MTTDTPHLRPSPVWSLITVTYNSAATLREFWTGAREFGPDVEWIVVDNASTDDSAETAESLGARVLKLDRNVGFGAANNVGFAQSESSYVAFVNPDVRPVASTLPRLREAIDRTGGLVAPQLLNADGTLQPNGRGYPFLVNKVMNRLQTGDDESAYRVYARPGEEVDVVWLMGAVVAGRRNTLEGLGPWDETFFVYYEDSDLGLRARRAGLRNILLGDAQWTHGWARATKAPSLAAWKRELPSLVKFYSRYPSLLSLAPHRASRRIDLKEGQT